MMPDEYSEIWAPDEGVEEDGTGGDDTDGAGTENEVLEKNNVQSADIEVGGQESGQTQLAAQVNALLRWLRLARLIGGRACDGADSWRTSA